jgi:hypothetical protein
VQKSATLTTTLPAKKCHSHYDMQKIKFYSLSVKNKNRK